MSHRLTVVVLISVLLSLALSQMTFTDNWQKRGEVKKNAPIFLSTVHGSGGAKMCSASSLISMTRELSFLLDTASRVSNQLSACSDHMLPSSSQSSCGSNRLERNPSLPVISSSNSRPFHSTSSQPNVPGLVYMMSSNRLANARRDSTVREIHLVDDGVVRDEEEDRVDIDDVRDMVRDDPVHLPDALPNLNNWQQNEDGESDWTANHLHQGDANNEGRSRRRSLNRAREPLANRATPSSSTWNNRRSSLSHQYPSSSSSISSMAAVPFVAPRNMQALNEDGSLTEYGESLIAGYSGMSNNSNTVRNINGTDHGVICYTSRGKERERERERERDWERRSKQSEERFSMVAIRVGSTVRNAAELAGVGDVLAFGRRRRTSPAERRRRNEARAAANALDPMGWQASKSTLKERISFMYCNDILADVYFAVGKEEARQRIPAHKFVLSIGSVVFDAMFNGGLAPNGESANSNDPVEIELPDVEPSSFLSLLRFLYSDDVSIGPDTVMTTLYTAKKYAVPALETACVDFLKQSLGADNAFMLLTQARLFDEQPLAQLCLELIDKHTPEALAAEGFTDVDLSTLCAVLSRDTLRIREMPLFQAVCRWAESVCHRRQLSLAGDSMRESLGSALNLIRFPLMTPEEFANGP
ncbi:hypothetical protein PFISCL1PPCAC_14705, partial [Pristionchus fissidentatus]